jgi:hypothetical protein
MTAEKTRVGEERKGKKKRESLFIHFCRMTVPKKKRPLMSFEGVNFPCLPNVKEVNSLLANYTVQSLEHNPLTSPKEYDVEAAEILDGGKLYIGMIFYLLYFLPNNTPYIIKIQIIKL